VERWISGSRPAEKTRHHLAAALSRRLGRIITEDGLGWAPADGHIDDTIGLTLDIDPIDALTPLRRGDVDLRHFLSASAYSVAAALPLQQVHERHGDRLHRHGRTSRRTARPHRMDPISPRRRGPTVPSSLPHRTSPPAVALSRRSSRTPGRLESYDAGQQGLAQRYYLHSYALAVESGVSGHDGFILRTMAMQGLKLGTPEHCLGLAEKRGWTAPAARSIPPPRRCFASLTPTPWPRADSGAGPWT
jgi:hypothetical protein